jgi:predicted transcriptional regulator
MAMTLRLTDDETADLRRQAEAEHRSMQEVARAAVREYIERRAHRSRVRQSSAFGATHYAEALDRLGNA